MCKYEARTAMTCKIKNPNLVYCLVKMVSYDRVRGGLTVGDTHP